VRMVRALTGADAGAARAALEKAGWSVRRGVGRGRGKAKG